MIIDYADWRPTAADLAGVNGVLRYLSRDPAKHATAAELDTLHRMGIGTGLVFEDAGNRASQGATAGDLDGKFAQEAALALGVPAGRPVYAAVDFDVPDYDAGSSDPRRKLGPVGDYLAAFQHAVRPYQLGAYGSFYLVSRVAAAHLTQWLWQTVAWSGGLVDSRITLFQPAITPPGMAADLDLAGHRDWGQFRHHAAWITGALA